MNQESGFNAPQAIPEREIEFVRKLVELAKEHGALWVKIEYRTLRHEMPNTDWGYPITATWTRGRHHESAALTIQTTLEARERV